MQRELKADSVLDIGLGAVVLLKDKGTDSTLPIFVGLLEGQSIAMAMGLPFNRPMTHDLFKNVLVDYGVMLIKIVITELHDKTYFANLCLKKGREEKIIDARPSDAIALALRFGSPIFIEERVLLEALDNDHTKEFLEWLEKNKPQIQ